MKVIVAGLSKTGTITVTAALGQLRGITTVYHFMDHYANFGSFWKKICEEGGTKEDFQRMYSNVDAVADVPAAYFWEELLEAYPEAKVRVYAHHKKKNMN